MLHAASLPLAVETAAQGTVAPVSYLVLPLHNRSRSAGLSWMSAALAATLAEKLEAHPSLRPAYGPQILLGLPVLDEARTQADRVLLRAKESGARWVFAGSFDRVNWKYQVDLRLYRVDPGPALDLVQVAETSVRAPSAATGSSIILDLLDQALWSLLQQAGLPLDRERDGALLRRPTRDVYALTLYGRALLSYYGLQGARGDLEQVQKTLSRVCFIDPKFAEAHRMLGLVELERGDSAKATGQYAHALDLRPSYFAALLGLSRLYRLADNRAKALEMADSALKLRPWDVETRLLLGELLWEGGQLAEAQAELLRVVSERPESLSARRTLALVYAARGLTAELAAELLRISSLVPDDVDVRLDLAAAYQRMGRLDQAVGVYQDVLQRRPRQVQAYRLLGDLYRKMGEPEKATVAYQKALRLAPDDPRPYFLLSAAYAEAGQEGKAEQVLQDAQQFRHYLGESFTNLGALALHREDNARAYWYLSRAVQRAGSRPRAHYNFALALDRLNQGERAVAEMRTATELDPQDAETRFALGVLLLRQGRNEEARQAFDEAQKLRPDYPDARHNLALLKDGAAR